MARKKKVEEEGGIDLTPMLDVVFIMLIFFIVTASFIKETGVEIIRPDATTSDEKYKSNILIAINANNEIWIDKNRVDERQVDNRIEQLRAENPKGGIVIQADNKASIKTLTMVVQAARDLGVTDIAVATEKN